VIIYQNVEFKVTLQLPKLYTICYVMITAAEAEWTVMVVWQNTIHRHSLALSSSLS